jgi:hypothetical protein
MTIQTHVESSDAEHDTKVSPMVRVRDVEPGVHILIRSSVGTKQTYFSSGRVGKVPASSRHEIAHVFATA